MPPSSKTRTFVVPILSSSNRHINPFSFVPNPYREEFIHLKICSTDSLCLSLPFSLVVVTQGEEVEKILSFSEGIRATSYKRPPVVAQPAYTQCRLNSVLGKRVVENIEKANCKGPRNKKTKTARLTLHLSSLADLGRETGLDGLDGPPGTARVAGNEAVGC